MKTYRLSILILLFTAFAHTGYSIHSESKRPGKEENTHIKKDTKDDRKMDALSLIAYISAVSGVASFFVAPALSLLLLPAGLIIGFIALVRGKKRFPQRKGRGLALTAVILGGAFFLLIAIELIIFFLFLGF